MTPAKRFELAFTAALVPISVLIFWQTSHIGAPVRQLEVSPRMVPMILAGLLVACALLVAAECWLPWLRARAAHPGIEKQGHAAVVEAPLFGDSEDEGVDDSVSKRTLTVITVVFLAAIFALEPLGFLVTATALVFSLSTYLAPRFFIRNAVVSVVCIALVSLLFRELGVHLPDGILALP